MNRAQKAEVVEDLGRIFADSGAVVVCHYTGMSVAEMSELRGEMRQAGATLRVAKNRLAKIALEGKPCAGIEKFMTGQTVLAYSEDPVAPAKAADAYAKKNPKLVVVGGAMGAELLDDKAVKALAAMPSREEVLASIIGAVLAPGANIAGAIGAPAANLAGLVKTLAEREGA